MVMKTVGKDIKPPPASSVAPETCAAASGFKRPSAVSTLLNVMGGIVASCHLVTSDVRQLWSVLEMRRLAFEAGAAFQNNLCWGVNGRKGRDHWSCPSQCSPAVWSLWSTCRRSRGADVCRADRRSLLETTLCKRENSHLLVSIIFCHGGASFWPIFPLEQRNHPRVSHYHGNGVISCETLVSGGFRTDC